MLLETSSPENPPFHPQIETLDSLADRFKDIQSRFIFEGTDIAATRQRILQIAEYLEGRPKILVAELREKIISFYKVLEIFQDPDNVQGI